MTATSVMFSTIVPDTVMADQHYFQPFENSPPEHDMTLSGDIDAIEDILSRHQNVSVNMDDLTLHPGSEDHPMDMDIPTTEFETNRDDLIREGERRREMSTTPTPPLSGSHHSSHSHHPNSPSASPSPNLTSRCDTKSGSSPPTPNYEPPPTFREWETFPHYISTPPKKTPIKLPIPQPPFATHTGEFKVCFISMGGTAEQDTFCVKTISSTKRDYVETVFSSLVGP